jgi:hypothetical protein
MNTTTGPDGYEQTQYVFRSANVTLTNYIYVGDEGKVGATQSHD